MKYQTGGDLGVQVAFGSLEVLPLSLGQMAEIELLPHGNVDVGRGRGQRNKIQVPGGLVGLIIDARGRPLVPPSDPAKRRERVQRWLWDVGA